LFGVSTTVSAFRFVPLSSGAGASSSSLALDVEDDPDDDPEDDPDDDADELDFLAAAASFAGV